MEDRSNFGKYGDIMAIALIIIGFLMMIQPFTMFLYTIGFPFILSGVIFYNVTSHY